MVTVRSARSETTNVEALPSLFPGVGSLVNEDTWALSTIVVPSGTKAFTVTVMTTTADAPGASAPVSAQVTSPAVGKHSHGPLAAENVVPGGIEFDSVGLVASDGPLLTIVIV